ncbi:MAG: PTS sugar transporter subunit IIA [Planctomycetes bacterium]|nr:PTS sugar transporter subunit IIA [Planctomycetota bacterium]
MIANLIDHAHVVASISATDKEGAIAEMLDSAAAAGVIKPAHRKPLREALLARERDGSTGIGNGVAVPHIKDAKQVKETTLIFGRSETGIPFDAVDGRDVQILFMVIGPQDSAERHLEVLRWVSGLARNADFRRFTQSAADADALRDLLHEMSAS